MRISCDINLAEIYYKSSYAYLQKDVIPHESRVGQVPYHGQVLGLSPCEDAMVKVSYFLHGSMKVTNVLVIEGKVDRLQLSAALNGLQAIHAVLQCKIVTLNDDTNDDDKYSPSSTLSETSIQESSSFALEVDNSLDIPLQYIDIAPDRDATTTAFDIDKEALKVWSSKIEKTPLQIGYPVASVTVISSSASSSSAILVTCEHAFCDGQSIGTLCHHLLLLLSGESTIQALSFVPSDSNSPPSALALWGPSFEAACQPRSPENLSMRMAGLQAFPPPDKVTPFPRKRFDQNAAQLSESGATFSQRFVLSKEQLDLLKRWCKERNCTVTGALAAAIMQAAADVIGGGSASSSSSSGSSTSSSSIVLSCAADTRKLYTAPLSSAYLSCHVSGVARYATELQESKAEGIATLAAAFRRHIEACLQVEYPLTISGMVGKVWLGYVNRTAPAPPPIMTVSLTNWGLLPLKQLYNPLGLTHLRLLHSFPAVNTSHVGTPAVLVTSAADMLTLTLSTHSEAIDKSDADKLLKAIHHYVLSVL